MKYVFLILCRNVSKIRKHFFIHVFSCSLVINNFSVDIPNPNGKLKFWNSHGDRGLGNVFFKFLIKIHFDKNGNFCFCVISFLCFYGIIFWYKPNLLSQGPNGNVSSRLTHPLLPQSNTIFPPLGLWKVYNAKFYNLSDEN